MRISQQIAATAVSQVMDGRNLTLALQNLWREHPHITAQQRAVAQDLSYGTLRFYGRLQALLTQLLEKPLPDERARCLLLVALYQLEFDQAATHTVVDQAVMAAAQLRKPWAKGLVNGVLRNFLRRREELIAIIADDEVARYSYPGWWIQKLKANYPAQWQTILEAGNHHPPLTLRVNRRLTDTEAYCRRLMEVGVAARQLGGDAVMLQHAVALDKLPGFALGEVSVQDYGAQLAGPLLEVSAGMRVLDACCAPGGKTGHILELAEVDMVAVDSDTQRLHRTRSNLDRLGLNAQLLTGDAANPTAWWDGKPFDRILADVPCTASGIVRRHVDIKWLRREADTSSFSRQQALILRGLWQLLANGGKLLYATCSIFPEENQRQIDAFLRHQTDARQLLLQHPESGQLLPCAEHDGFFYAVLQKN